MKELSEQRKIELRIATRNYPKREAIFNSPDEYLMHSGKHDFTAEGRRLVWYVAPTTGCLDMREVQGPFYDYKDAVLEAAGKDCLWMGNGLPSGNCYIGSWYTIHPEASFVEGPFPYQKTAEAERKFNIKKQEEVKEANSEGFTARVIAIYGEWAIFVTSPKE